MKLRSDGGRRPAPPGSPVAPRPRAGKAGKRARARENFLGDPDLVSYLTKRDPHPDHLRMPPPSKLNKR